MEHVTISEAAALLQLSVPTIKRYIYQGVLRSAKLPGGQHRIPRAEIDRLLTVHAEELVAASVEASDHPVEERLGLLESWVTDLQVENERLGASLEVLSRVCTRLMERAGEGGEAHVPAPEDARVIVLGPGCRRCDALYIQARKVLDGMGLKTTAMTHVRDVDEIADYGPVLTPALLIDGQLVASGRIPSEEALRRAFGAALGSPAEAARPR